jgi:hypothetical protein
MGFREYRRPARALEMNVIQALGQPAESHQVLRLRLPLLQRFVIEDGHGRRAGVEVDFVAAHRVFLLSCPVIKLDHGRGRGQAFFDQRRFRCTRCFPTFIPAS